MIDFAYDPVCQDLWETIVARPGGVIKRGAIFAGIASLVGGSSGWAIYSDELALALIDAVMSGSEEQLLEPQQLLKRGRNLMKKTLEPEK